MQWSCHVLPFYQEQPRCAECWENHSIGLLPTWSHLVATQVYTTLSQLSQLVARATLPPILSTLTHRCRFSHHHISLPAQLVKQNGSANRRFWTKHSGILDVPPAHQKKIAHVLEKWSVFPMFHFFESLWIFMIIMAKRTNGFQFTNRSEIPHSESSIAILCGFNRFHELFRLWEAEQFHLRHKWRWSVPNVCTNRHFLQTETNSIWNVSDYARLGNKIET